MHIERALASRRAPLSEAPGRGPAARRGGTLYGDSEAMGTSKYHSFLGRLLTRPLISGQVGSGQVRSAVLVHLPPASPETLTEDDSLNVPLSHTRTVTRMWRG